MRSNFLQILLSFSPPEGYQLQFSISRAYFVYTVWHCIGQHCSSMYSCKYRLFAGTWGPLVSVITTLYRVAIIFHHRVYAFSALRMYSMFEHHPHPRVTFVPNFVSFATSITQLFHAEK